MNAHEPFSSATLSARRWPQVRFSSISLMTSFAARCESIALVSRRRFAISLRMASAALFDLWRCSPSSSRVSSSSTVSTVDFTLADRGLSSNSESSPKYSPVRTSLRTTGGVSLSGGGRKICTAPVSTMYIDDPESPLVKTVSSGLKVFSDRRWASASRSSSESPSKRGICASRSACRIRLDYHAIMRRVLRAVVLALAMIAVGVDHFVLPDFFVRIVPRALPSPLFLVQLSGVCEVLGGLGLLVPRTRRAAGVGLVLLYVAVFPANVNMVIHPELGGAVPLWALWVRPAVSARLHRARALDVRRLPSRAVRRFGPAWLALAVVLVSVWSLAQQPPPGVRLDYEADPRCSAVLSPDTFIAEVHARSARSASPPTLHARSSSAWCASARASSAAASSSAKPTVRPPSASSAAAHVKRWSPPSASSRPSPSIPSRRPTRAQAPPQARPRPPRRPPSPPRPRRRPPQRRRPQTMAPSATSPSTSARGRSPPAPTPRPSSASPLFPCSRSPSISKRPAPQSPRRPGWGLRFERAGETALSASVGADFTWTIGSLDLCVILRADRLRFDGCARVDAGTMEAHGEGVVPQRSATRPWVDVGGALGLRLRIARPRLPRGCRSNRRGHRARPLLPRAQHHGLPGVGSDRARQRRGGVRDLVINTLYNLVIGFRCREH